MKGIYVIPDTDTGRLYVGKASGADGIWGRCCAYASNGHGDNAAKPEFMRGIVCRQPADADEAHAHGWNGTAVGILPGQVSMGHRWRITGWLLGK